MLLFSSSLPSFHARHASTKHPDGAPRRTLTSLKFVNPGTSAIRCSRRISPATLSTELIPSIVSRRASAFFPLPVGLFSGGGFSAMILSTDSSDAPRPGCGARSARR